MRYTILSRDSCPILSIYTMGYSSDPAVTKFGPGQRNQYIIHYVLSGKGFFNGFPVRAGQGFLITPALLEEYHSAPDDPWSFLWIISEDEKMKEIFEAYHADEESHIFQYHFLHEVCALADRIVENHNTTFTAYEMLELFLNIFKHHLESPHAVPQTNAALYVEAAEKYIRNNLSFPVTVSELTQFLGVSQPYLFRIFKNTFSKSPKQYILDFKLNNAEKLLRETTMTITQVANSVGFSDVLSFSKFFSAKMGISPQQYRKKF